ncbi:MAG TPA: glycosyl hydrolase [Roseiflexaceae bacterium]|nr:glycosyl hydrolase [Roseiflexaceae bacterium]
MTTRLSPILLILCVLAVWLTAAPPPAPAAPGHAVAPLDDAPFGINTHLATRYFDPASVHVPAEIVAQSGAGWAREDIHWFRIQPDPDTWDWTATDAAMRELIRREITIVGVLGHPPGWATPEPGDAPAGVSFYAPDPQRFAAFAEAVVGRYGRYVHHWEIWNEPDNPLFWRPAPDPQAYAHLLQWAAAAVRRVDPQAKVLLGGVNPNDTHFLRRVAEQGAWGSFDILAIHPYVSPSSPEAGNIAAAADGPRAVAAQYGQKPIWATEVGWSSGPGDRDPQGVVDEQAQADFLVRATLLLWQAGVERIFWYTLKDDPGNPYGLVALGGGYGDYTQLKPAYHAFRTLSRQLGGASLAGVRDLFRRTTVLDFEQFGAWRRGDQPYGTMAPTEALQHGGRAAAQISYSFPSAANEYLVFRRERPAPIPGQPYAVGLWVYGDGSGNALKLWLRDREGEVLQYALGAVGPPGWRLLQAQVGGAVAPWDRISEGGDGRLDFPARLEAIVLDDAPDTFAGRGTIVVDDLVALSGPEAYDMQLQRGGEALDVLWAPTPVRASIETAALSALVVSRDGTERSVAAVAGRIELDLGPAPVYVRHRR